MPKRAHSMIRYVVAETPDVEIAFVAALAVDAYFIKDDAATRVMFLNPVHREFVETLRQPPADS